MQNDENRMTDAQGNAFEPHIDEETALRLRLEERRKARRERQERRRRERRRKRLLLLCCVLLLWALPGFGAEDISVRIQRRKR